jgi:hypothetical protein
MVTAKLQNPAVPSIVSVGCLLPCGRSSLWPTSVIFHLIDSPNGTLDILHTHEAFVERQIVPNGVLLNKPPTKNIQETQQNHTWVQGFSVFLVDGID